MKIKDIIENVNKSKEFENVVDICQFGEEFCSISFCVGWVEQNRLKSYWFSHWLCTDTWVGQKVYFFDEKPVAISKQMFRKSDEEIMWISIEDYDNVKKYIETLVRDDNRDTIKVVNLDEDFGETFKIEFYSQMFQIHKDVITSFYHMYIYC